MTDKMNLFKPACRLSRREFLGGCEMTTSIKFDPRKKQVIFHQGKTVANIDEDKACRKKLAVEVKGNIDKLFNHWDQWSWHRVTFYGDFKHPVRHIAALFGYEVVEEA